MTNAGGIDADYRGEGKVVLANLRDQLYRVEKGDPIAQLIIKTIDNQELQEVAQLDHTPRGNPGFESSDNTQEQKVKGQCAKQKKEINKILAMAFEQFYHRGEMTCIV